MKPSYSPNFKVDFKPNFGSATYMFCNFGQGDEIICLHIFQIILLRIVDIIQTTISITNSDC
jgi:hypothetical protein